jgi:hypothetical protein
MTDAPRSHLRTQPAPSGAAPTVVSFSLTFLSGTLTVAYVPDRVLLDADSLREYTRSMPRMSPEQAVATIADDIANEIVPKWHRITLKAPVSGMKQTVIAEDRQPGWTHPSLLDALR